MATGTLQEIRLELNPPLCLSPWERALLLNAQLRLFVRRSSCGIPISHADLVRAALFADAGVAVGPDGGRK
jgi:hypothetical protein